MDNFIGCTFAILFLFGAGTVMWLIFFLDDLFKGNFNSRAGSAVGQMVLLIIILGVVTGRALWLDKVNAEYKNYVKYEYILKNDLPYVETEVFTNGKDTIGGVRQYKIPTGSPDRYVSFSVEYVKNKKR